MFVRECMDTPAVTVRPETTLQKALNQMELEGHRRFVVVNDKGRLMGIITTLDLKQALPSPVNSLDKWELRYLLSHIQVKDVMTKKVITTAPDVPLERAVGMMMDHEIGGLPVVDGENRVHGMITVSNILHLCFGRKKKGSLLSFGGQDRV